MKFEYGVTTRLSPLVRRVIARNPGPFTFHGTGTFIIGHDKVAIVDPGPAEKAHIDAILRTIRGESVTHILVTHTHSDHSAAAAELSHLTGSATFAFGAHGGERSDSSVEEGADFDFIPDHTMSDGDTVNGPGWTITALHTPGHTSNHLCYELAEEATLLSGDHVMGWSTTVIAPPDGRMGDYLSSLRKLLERDDQLFRPTHGPAITNPKSLVTSFLNHRAKRITQILRCVRNGEYTIEEIVRSIYANHDPRLHRAAAHSIFAHLIGMVEDEHVSCEDAIPTLVSHYSPVN